MRRSMCDEVAAVVAVLAVLVVWNMDWKLVIATMAGTPFWSEAPTGAPISPTEDIYLKRLSQSVLERTTKHALSVFPTFIVARYFLTHWPEADSTYCPAGVRSISCRPATA